MRKNRKSDYIIMALICLVVLNIGSILIGSYSSKGENLTIKEASVNIITVSARYIKNNLNLKGVINQVVSSVYPIREASVEGYDEDLLHEQIEDLEIKTEEDILIQDLEEYESLILIKDSCGLNTVENIPRPININKLVVDEDRPYILLYHTHTTESYIPARDNNFHVSDKNYNVLGIGEILTKVLEAGGHKVDHNHVYHDLPSYNKSYSRSLNTINKKREESDNLKVLLDVHRDAVQEDSPNIQALRERSKVNIDGKEVATFTLVIGPDSDNKDQVLSFAKYIKAVSDTLYPGLCRGIIVKPTGKYNQYKSDYSALLEIGYNINTVEQASESAKLVGEILSLVLTSIKEQ